MRIAILALCAAAWIASCSAARAQESQPVVPPSKNVPEEADLERALASSGNDSAALVRNLKAYLRKYPDALRKAAVYRALVEACQQTSDTACALEYSERFVAVRPDDSQMMLLAVNLLEQQGSDASLTRAAGYVTRALDQVEKAVPAEKPASESLAEWRDGQQKLRATLYYVRGRVENSLGNLDAAAKDLRSSDSALPSALAAELLGEIAEMRNDSATAIVEYVRAFVLPEDGPMGKVDRLEVRRKLGNLWKLVHGSEEGLGQAILDAYDVINPGVSQWASGDAASSKKSAKSFSDFVVRRMDGSSLPLASFATKILVLNFWATWCGPCRELEPMFNRVARGYDSNPDVVFLAVNTDDDKAQVAPFVAREKWSIPVVYADGLDDFMKVDSLPAILIVGRGGEIVYRVNGLPRAGFSDSLSAAIASALNSVLSPSQSPAP